MRIFPAQAVIHGHRLVNIDAGLRWCERELVLEFRPAGMSS